MVRVSTKAGKLATFWRFLFLAIFFIILIPHDVYAPGWQPFDTRWGFWANKVTEHTLPLNGTAITISLENCNLYFEPGTSTDLEFRVSRQFGVSVNSTDTFL